MKKRPGSVIQPRTSQCNIRLSPAEWQHLEQLAQHYGLKPYETLRLILRAAQPTDLPLVRFVGLGGGHKQDHVDGDGYHRKTAQQPGRERP